MWLWRIFSGEDGSAVALWERWAFLLTVFVAAGLVWLVPYPPMTDLPQHVGQIAAAQNMLSGHFAFAQDVQFNWFTPYLALYGPALLLSFMVPALIAVKLVITAGFLFYVAMAQRFVRAFGGPEFCRWLLLPGYFGFAWQYGMITFLLAVPFGLLFILQARRAMAAPQLQNQMRLLLFGVLVFFAHALVFVFVLLVSGLLLLERFRFNWRPLVCTSWPYVVLAGFFVTYMAVGAGYSAQPEAAVLIWDIDPRIRLAWFAQALTGVENYAPLKYLGVLVLVLPLFLARADFVSAAQLMPLLGLVLVWFFLPVFAFSTGLFYPRFAVFLLPFYLPLFVQLRPAGAPRQLAQAGMIIVVWVVLALSAMAAFAFDRDNRDFLPVAALLEQQPAARILSLAAGTGSKTVHNDQVYTHYATWLQAQGRHWVEFNFAVFRPQLIRYAGKLPLVQRTSQSAPAENQLAFDWKTHDGSRYDYFVVFSQNPVSEAVFANPACPVSQVLSSGRWRVFKRGVCG